MNANLFSNKDSCCVFVYKNSILVLIRYQKWFPADNGHRVKIQLILFQDFGRSHTIITRSKHVFFAVDNHLTN